MDGNQLSSDYMEKTATKISFLMLGRMLTPPGILWSDADGGVLLHSVLVRFTALRDSAKIEEPNSLRNVL